MCVCASVLSVDDTPEQIVIDMARKLPSLAGDICAIGDRYQDDKKNNRGNIFSTCTMKACVLMPAKRVPRITICGGLPK